MASLNGRVALVTGAGGRWGEAIVRALRDRGAAVAVQATDPAAIAARMAGAPPDAADPNLLAIAADLGDALAAQRLVDEVYRWHGRLDVVVNAGDRGGDGVLLGITAEEWQATFRDLVHGAFHVSQAAAKYMLLDRRGRIVNVASLAALHPQRAQTLAAATYGALVGMTRALAVELAPKNITVNAVAPGPTEGAGDRLIEKIPLQRVTTPQDVAELVAFLASDEASYMTGEVLSVDGGFGGRR